MKGSKKALTALLFAAVAFAVVPSAWAQMGGHGGMMGGGSMGGGQMGGGQTGGGMVMGVKPNPGEMMNQGKAGAYEVRFHNMPMKMEGATNHLMVYILGADGKAILGAKPAYKITGPDGKVQEVMCSAMGNGYGGNVDFSQSGKYDIKLQAALGTENVSYFFEYNVK